jgi:uncharacterized protein
MGRAASTPGSLPETKTMTVLASLFLGRVLGQLMVSRRRVRFLPPMEQWQSGLLPYPALLAAQGIVLTLQAATIVQSLRGHGAFVTQRPRAGRALQTFSAAYFGSMGVRYWVSVWRYPERRWLGKSIPIWFHCVLAGYLAVYSRLLRRTAVDGSNRSS